MNQAVLEGYIFISIVIALTDLFLAAASMRKRSATGRYLGLTCVAAAVVDISYLLSILSDSYFCVSVMSSLYFVSIDVMLVCLLNFTVHFTKYNFTKGLRMALRLAGLYACFETAMFALNPFYEVALGYVHRDTVIARYAYQMKPLYWLHLLFTYALVAAVLALLIVKLCRVPREYRAQFLYVIAGIVVLVAVNGVFLFLPGVSVFNLLDYSICGYSLTAFLMYWCCFNYSTHGMLNRLKTSIFENIDQGLVLFDYNDDLILHNAKADYLLGGMELKETMRLQEFLSVCNLSVSPEAENDSFCVQCSIQTGDQARLLRCDIRRLKNDRAQILGRLFVFSDAALETDPLTGFQNWESFQRFAKEGEVHFAFPTAVAICDINSLSVINSTNGNSAGDQKIQLLADTMRQQFPRRTYFVRGLEANLIALCSHSEEAEVKQCLEQVRERFDGKIQYAVSIASEQQPDILQAIHEAATAMRAKKLLDQESARSEILTSLIRALQECDSDTEHHVRRTQIMGAALGRRIALTDMQQSQLSLLCLLHDIGKIGIPLEILNKPGKLSEEEWAILKTHTDKGCEIAGSSNELKGISDAIRHHHERWDGRGYPDGLCQEEIPLLSRVISVVDAYDAMVSDRAYRAALPREKAMEELRRCAGTQFDPRIVSEFLVMLEESPDLTETSVSDGTTVPVVKAQPPQAAESEQTSGNTYPVDYCRYLLDASMRIVHMDENFENMTGYAPEEVRRRAMTQADLIPEEERADYQRRISAMLGKSTKVFLEHKLRRKDGTDIYVLCYGRVYYDSAVRAERSEIIITNLSTTHSVRMLMKTGTASPEQDG